jgi:hypothetical protein
MAMKSGRSPSPPQVDQVELSIRLESEDVSTVLLSSAEPAMWDEAIPWRTFRWYFGKCHYSGAYWSTTEAAHVIYESRLELSRLLLADFDPEVSHIVAQPFLMRAVVGGVRRLLENVRFLAGYRRRPYVSPAALDELYAMNLVGRPFGEVLRHTKSPAPLARAALLHMLWSHELTADLNEALTDKTILRQGTMP